MKHFIAKFLTKKDKNGESVGKTNESVKPTKPFSERSKEEREAVLRSGAKSFSRDFSITMQQLANE